MNASTAKPRRAVIYARLSVAAEESVSIERQIEACKKYCEARGFEIIADPFIDDGVSATKARPEQRDGWSSVLKLKQRYDVVVVWKVDRLARRVLDFLHADQALQERGAAIMAVEDPIDMSTAQGRAFATMLAVFGEMEAAAIGARVKAAREHLVVRAGRVAGGERPWPYALAPNPDGHGYVLEAIPERAKLIEEAAAVLIAGDISVSEIARRWDAAGFGPKRKKRNGKLGRATWSPSSVRNLLRNPILYGATVYQDSLLRNKDGSIKIGPHKILDRGTWELLQRAISHDGRGRPTIDPPMLHHIARCASCGEVLGVHRPSTRASTNWKYMCRNRDCRAKVYVSMERLEEHVTNDFLKNFGDQTEQHAVGGAKVDPLILAELEAELLDIEDALEITDDEPEVLKLIRRRKAARADLAALQDAAEEGVVWEPTGTTMREAFAAAADKDEKRLLLNRTAQPTVWVGPGEGGRKGLDEERVEIVYNLPPSGYPQTTKPHRRMPVPSGKAEPSAAVYAVARQAWEADNEDR